MKKLIKKLCDSLRINSVGALKQQSEDILSVFTKTMNELSEVNINIQSGITQRQTRINKLEKEQVDLKGIQISNSKVIKKLNSIMED